MFTFDHAKRYPSRRSPVMCRRGAVATSHPLAAQAGLQMLTRGGNAVDAAIAGAAALTVLEPTSNGLGSDAFALIWDGRELHGLNASGRSPGALNLELVKQQGHTEMPREGWLPVTVPGAVSAWTALSQRFGSLPLEEVLAPAITYAEEGHPVPPVIARMWQASERRFANRDDFRQAFLPAPLAGQVCRFPEQGRTLRMIGESNGEAFYRGALAEAIVDHARKTGGYLSLQDMAAHQPEWVDPIRVRYRGYDVWEIPPNGQGLAALIALNILEEKQAASYDHLSVEQVHLVLEALKLAFADAHAYIADPAVTPVPTEELLAKDYAAQRAGLISSESALPGPAPGLPREGDTVYLCTADGDGQMVSFIQSNYMGFGSGVVVPGTGISLQNRGAGFSLVEGHPNQLAPGKRPFHTIIPAFLTKDGVPLAAFGVMGGDMQPQGHVQVMLGMIDHGLDPQAAIDAPRVRVAADNKVWMESGFSDQARASIAKLGHDLQDPTIGDPYGGGQMIWRDPETGVLTAASEPRKDGQAVGW